MKDPEAVDGDRTLLLPSPAEPVDVVEGKAAGLGERVHYLGRSDIYRFPGPPGGPD